LTDLLSHLARWRPFSAIVVGDFMLDELVFGDADRLSPEAPVPVMRVDRTERRPGGAANVCLDLAALGGSVRALGVTGADADAARLREALAGDGVDASGLIEDAGRPTTVKRSLIGLAQHRHAQKMFRLDVESARPVDAEVEARLLTAFESALAEPPAVVCLEDYGKGVCTPGVCAGVIERCRRAGVPVLVDPARRLDYAVYAGASCVTPNRTEAAEAAASVGADPGAGAEAIGLALVGRLDLEAAVLTLDREGALLAERGADPVRVGTVAREVYDVTGAGDMVLAALAAARANGVGWRDAVRFANAAAGLEVEVFGVAPIPFERVHHAVMRQSGRLDGKARTLEDLLVEVAAHRREGRSIVFTNGCFDVLHAGHIALLRQAARLGDTLIVAVNSDGSVRRLKGEGRPVHPIGDRVEVLSELQSVSAVVVFEEDTPIDLIRAIRPDVLVKGADYSPDRVVGAECVSEWGGRVELIPLLDGRSTTSAIERMRAT